MPEQLLGRPVYESSEMVSAVTTGSNLILAGDFSEYLIYDRVGMSLVYDPVVLGANRIPSGQGGFFAFWRVGATAVNPNAFRVLKL
jgi:HK97 family phage major capsid protein